MLTFPAELLCMKIIQLLLDKFKSQQNAHVAEFIFVWKLFISKI